MVQERSAGAIVFRKVDGKRLYLLLHYVSGHWDFVKGHIEKNESAEQTIRREAVEETGMRDLSFVPGFEESVKYFFHRGKSTVAKVVVFKLAETKTETVVLGSPEEHQGFEWLPYDRAVERTTFETARSVLRKAEEFLNKGPAGLFRFAK